MGSWHIAVNLLFPLPLLVLFLLSIPLPRFLANTSIRSTLIRLLDAVIFIKIYGDLTVYSFATGLSTILFVITAHETFHANLKQKNAVHVHERDQFRCQRWRMERNFWISLLSLVLWVILHRVRALIKEIESAKATNEYLAGRMEKELKKEK
jgi:hypothetical protein|mmetsp:Transcript_19380/g.18724  ORF Transcript_19380/g.18724 Transcript_19380/m.18724 type:complete len:152 (+) Transcript_19380:190-645(+)